MFGNLLKKRQAPETEINPGDFAAILAKLRATTQDADLAKLIDMQCAQILRDHLPMLGAVKQSGVRLQRNADSMSLAKIHDIAFEVLAENPFPGRKPISANAREGGRQVAEIMDGVVARALLLADDETHVNRMAFLRIMHASSLLIEAADKLTFLPPPQKKEQHNGDSTTAA